MFDVAIFDGKANNDWTEKPYRFRNIRPSMSRDRKVVIQTSAHCAPRHLEELVDLNLIEKKFGHH